MILNYDNAREIELALINYFDVQKYIIVPNVSYGIFPYELDLCMLNYRGRYATEVEIKISKSDLKRDGKKWHSHDHNYNYIKYLYFAMPIKMKGCEEFVQENAGILWVDNKGKVEVARKPVPNKLARKWDDKMAFKLARLGTMRYWKLRDNNIRW